MASIRHNEQKQICLKKKGGGQKNENKMLTEESRHARPKYFNADGLSWDVCSFVQMCPKLHFYFISIWRRERQDNLPVRHSKSTK
jgi:hypothetical protein